VGRSHIIHRTDLDRTIWAWPLAKKTIAGGPAQVRITFERFPHHKTPSVIELHLPDRTLQAGHVRIRLEGAVADKAAFQQIIPQPISASPLIDGIEADIPLTAASSGGRIMILQQPSAVGSLISRIALEDGPPLAFKQFVLP
jgi:hypothetical protein